MTAGEARNPRRNIPKAIRRVFYRIMLFYIGGTFIIGLLVPSNNPDLPLSSTAAGSPFVIAINTAGIKGLPSVINAALITSAWSAASSDLYTSSRALYGLALAGNAPKFFAKTTRKGLPYTSIIFCAAFAPLSYMGIKSGSGKVFNWFANMTAIAGLMTWFGIAVTYIRFYKGYTAQGFNRKDLPFYSRFTPYAAWYAAIACPFICFFSGFQVFLKVDGVSFWNTATFVTNYLPFILFPLLYLIGRIFYRQGPVKPLDMDFITGIKEIEASSHEETTPRNKLEKFWRWLM